jgi:hypothetical protein
MLSCVELICIKYLPFLVVQNNLYTLMCTGDRYGEIQCQEVK